MIDNDAFKKLTDATVAKLKLERAMVLMGGFAPDLSGEAAVILDKLKRRLQAKVMRDDATGTFAFTEDVP